MSDRGWPGATKVSTIVLNMVALSTPLNVLFGKTRQAILALTFLRPDEAFYLRDIVRRTGCGTGAVQRELKLLTASGILIVDRDRFFRANAGSPVFEPLKELVIRTIGIGDRLRAALAGFAAQIRIAFIFGSFARGEQHERSDVDLLIISKDDLLSDEALHAALRREEAALGRELNPFVLSEAEWRVKSRRQNPFVQKVTQDKKIFLIGDEDELGRVAAKRMATAPLSSAAGNLRSARTVKTRPSKRKNQGARR